MPEVSSTISVTLEFETAGEITVEAEVREFAKARTARAGTAWGG